MERGRTKSTNKRRPSIEELEWLRLTLTNIGGQYGDIVEKQSWNAFVLLDDLLSPASSPQDWLRNGAAAWVEGLRATGDLVQGVCSTLFRSVGTSVRHTKIEREDITFFVDESTEATDPVATEIPLEMIGKVKVSKVGDNLTLSPDHKTVLVALYNLSVPATTPRKKGTPSEATGKRVSRLGAGRHSAKLSWGNGTKKEMLTITADVSSNTP